jgi:sporulation protein YabP
MLNYNEQPKLHNIIIENRKKIILTGVKEVESFSEDFLIAITHSGGLKIKGCNLEISKISVETGDLEMTGEVTSLYYSELDRTPNNIITKLFR